VDWIGLSSVLRPRQHSIGYMGDGELGEVENECTSYHSRLFAIFVEKIIRVGGNFTTL